MYWRSAGEIEDAQLVCPAAGVPRPTCDGIVYDRTPDEHEYNAREDTTTLSSGTSGQRNSVELRLASVVCCEKVKPNASYSRY